MPNARQKKPASKMKQHAAAAQERERRNARVAKNAACKSRQPHTHTHTHAPREDWHPYSSHHLCKSLSFHSTKQRGAIPDSLRGPLQQRSNPCWSTGSHYHRRCNGVIQIQSVRQLAESVGLRGVVGREPQVRARGVRVGLGQIRLENLEQPEIRVLQTSLPAVPVLGIHGVVLVLRRRALLAAWGVLLRHRRCRRVIQIQSVR
mmetsp:Transcript_71741/g.164500  ORF Transcript_71741/g.164500 Transcript_71741/m.164500 type:complete len:204 (-) Transcript_71741:188-799(-)